VDVSTLCKGNLVLLAAGGGRELILVQKECDLDVNDCTHRCASHLSHLLRAGDLTREDFEGQSDCVFSWAARGNSDLVGKHG
jgi:hypothetical protein